MGFALLMTQRNVIQFDSGSLSINSGPYGICIRLILYVYGRSTRPRSTKQNGSGWFCVRTPMPKSVLLFDSSVARQIMPKMGFATGDHTPSAHRRSTRRITAPHYVIMQRVVRRRNTIVQECRAGFDPPSVLPAYLTVE